MNKRFFRLSLAIILGLIFSFSLDGTALASTEPVSIIEPNFTYILTAGSDFDIDSSGKAEMSSAITTYNGTVDQVRMNNYLQRYQNGAWTVVNNWSQTTQGINAYWAKTYYVSSGYSYRLRTYFYTYDGSSIVESTSTTSNSIYY